MVKLLFIVFVVVSLKVKFGVVENVWFLCVINCSYWVGCCRNVIGFVSIVLYFMIIGV